MWLKNPDIEVCTFITTPLEAICYDVLSSLMCGFKIIHHNEIRDLIANLMTDVLMQ